MVLIVVTRGSVLTWVTQTFVYIWKTGLTNVMFHICICTLGSYSSSTNNEFIHESEHWRRGEFVLLPNNEVARIQSNSIAYEGSCQSMVYRSVVLCTIKVMTNEDKTANKQRSRVKVKRQFQ